MSQYYLRKAKVHDVRAIHSMLMDNARDDLLLPRSLSSLFKSLRDFYVVASRETDQAYGCVALAITWEDLAEVRSLAVLPELRGHGWGKKLVEACLSDAVTLGLYRVFTLTYQKDFFAKIGFEVVEKEVLPHKVWSDCLECPKFPNCDEIAMLMNL